MLECTGSISLLIGSYTAPDNFIKVKCQKTATATKTREFVYWVYMAALTVATITH